MAETKLMTEEEKHELLTKQWEAMENGDLDEVLRIRSIVPLDAKLANSAKKVYGLQYLIDEGYNLSEAEDVYGKEWSLR